MLVVALALLVTVHLSIGRLRLPGPVPRAWGLSAAGGAAVAYVFVHTLPELAEHHRIVVVEQGRPLDLYWVALAGLATFYALEHRFRGAGARAGTGPPDHGDYAVHAGSFAAYNLLIGYLLHERAAAGAGALAAYAVAMALHFVTTDHGLRQDYAHRYDRSARWLFSAAVIAGAALGTVVELEPVIVGAGYAFLAGGIVLNVIKEELPEDRQSRLGPFLAGAAGYAALLAAAG